MSKSLIREYSDDISDELSDQLLRPTTSAENDFQKFFEVEVDQDILA